MGTSNPDSIPVEAPRHVSLTYNNADSRATALRLVLALRPEWQLWEGPIEFVRFTDGITNTLLKAVKKRPGFSEYDIDRDAVLLRAYGKGTDVLIDRDREARAHALLAARGLAPRLIARFDNGLSYKFIPGTPCSPADFRRPKVWPAIARRLAEWHATVPITTISNIEPNDHLTPGQPVPNIWTTMQRWLGALSLNTEAERNRKTQLEEEFGRLLKEFRDAPGLAGKDYVFAHCDLLSGNVILEPPLTDEERQLLASDASSQTSESSQASGAGEPQIVAFIDYEYCSPAPPAFDIANHFAEYAGLECDYSAVPTRSERREWLRSYLCTFDAMLSRPFCPPDTERDLAMLEAQVDAFRGLPGFYWGIWALIQAMISQIDFDYATYAEQRLGEYWAWRGEADGSRAKQGREMPLRERRWAAAE
ncbi:kinase-like domain-containing protein [Lineolata rhizophorae]|uniref:ethanolamine kinase n=1 Tax=Lineolata rhizophorae TaxID=578093 RepID=A0A6A6PBV0_9PEZI|nr:kinase-like domain-containing protein [Lineolata rhizophorae]